MERGPESFTVLRSVFNYLSFFMLNIVIMMRILVLVQELDEDFHVAVSFLLSFFLNADNLLVVNI